MQEASVISWLGGEGGEIWFGRRLNTSYSHGGSSGGSYVGSFAIIEYEYRDKNRIDKRPEKGKGEAILELPCWVL